MASFLKDIEGSFIDKTVDGIVDKFIPDKNDKLIYSFSKLPEKGEIGRVAEAGVNQFINNEINSVLTPGALGGNSNQGQGGSNEKFW